MSSEIETALLHHLPVLNKKLDRMVEQVAQGLREVAEIKTRISVLEIAVCCAKKDAAPKDMPSIPVEDLFKQLQAGAEQLDRKFGNGFFAW